MGGREGEMEVGGERERERESERRERDCLDICIDSGMLMSTHLNTSINTRAHTS